MNPTLNAGSAMETHTRTTTGQKREPRMTEACTNLLNALRQKTAKVGVIGLGYVGLPLANLFHQKGFQVVGFDVDQRKVDTLNAGRSYIGHIPNERVVELMGNGRFVPTTGFSKNREIDTVSICVPTPLDEYREPDLSFIESTGRSIAPHIRQGQLIVLESTTYPGTTKEILQPILEAGSSLRAGEHFFLAYSPEREDPGNASFSTSTIPKVVGCMDAESRAVAGALREQAAAKVGPVSSVGGAGACESL